MSILSIQGSELDQFNQLLLSRKQRVHEYLASETYKNRIQPAHVYEGAYAYIHRTGKALRPVGLLWCCGALGGREREYLALPAAAAVEVFHTWGLVHDDIIDMDDLRRGGPTIHKLFSQISRDEWGYNQKDADRYGLAMAILAGDALMGWSVLLLTEMYAVEAISKEVTNYLITQLVGVFTLGIIEGEARDIQYEKFPVDKLTENDLLDMSYKKTGNIYTLAGLAGAIIGINRADPDDLRVKGLKTFTTNCGLAFQLIDDVLNLVGDIKTTGKAVGSDVIIGKRTIPIIYAMRQSKGKDHTVLVNVFGNALASPAEIDAAINVIDRIGGIAYTRELASRLVQEAFSKLEALPESEYKNYLEMWGRRIVDRKV